MTKVSFRGVARRVSHGALLTAVMSGLFVAPAEAGGGSVSCGAHLTRDTVLRKDLRCAGNGLTIAPGVDLDLGGHRVIGDGTGTAITAGDAESVSIRNGTITGWEWGLDLVGASPFPTSPVQISRLSIKDAPLNFQALNASLLRSTLSNSPLTQQGSTLRVTRSTLKASNIGGELNETILTRSRVLGGGVGLEENNSVTVVDSTMDGAGYDGPPMLCAGPNVIQRSSVRHYRDSIQADPNICPLTVAGSTFRDNPNGAIAAFGGPQTATIRDSRFRSSGVAVSGSGLTISGSRFVANITGVLVTDDLSTATVSAVTDSVFRRNARSGIIGETPGLALGGNVAVRNGGYGILAPGANDLGGNRAHGNALGQCVGVACTS
jgi:hypothetical protein